MLVRSMHMRDNDNVLPSGGLLSSSAGWLAGWLPVGKPSCFFPGGWKIKQETLDGWMDPLRGSPEMRGHHDNKYESRHGAVGRAQYHNLNPFNLSVNAALGGFVLVTQQ